MAAVEQQLGVSPQELMQRLMSRPDLLAKVQDPEVGWSDGGLLSTRQQACLQLCAAHLPSERFRQLQAHVRWPSEVCWVCRSRTR